VGTVVDHEQVVDEPGASTRSRRTVSTIAPMVAPRSGRDADRDLHFLLQRSQFANREVGVV